MRVNLLATAAAAALLMAGAALAQDNDRHNGRGGDQPAAAGAMSGLQDQDNTAGTRDKDKPGGTRDKDKTGGMRDQDKTGGMQNTDMDRDRGTNDRMIQGGAQPGLERRDRMGRDNDDTRVNVRRNGSVHITTDQRMRIRNVVRVGAPRLNHVNFRIGVGTRVPRSVRVVALPPEIIEIEPQWADFSYFVYGNEIVVIDPASFAIVGVLPI